MNTRLPAGDRLEQRHRRQHRQRRRQDDPEENAQLARAVDPRRLQYGGRSEVAKNVRVTSTRNAGMSSGMMSAQSVFVG